MLPQLPMELVNKILVTRPTHPVAQLIVNAGKVDYFKQRLEDLQSIGEEAHCQIWNYDEDVAPDGPKPNRKEYLEDERNHCGDDVRYPTETHCDYPATPVKRFFIQFRELDRYYNQEKDHIAGEVQTSIANVNRSLFDIYPWTETCEEEHLLGMGIWCGAGLMVDGKKSFLYREVYTKVPRSSGDNGSSSRHKQNRGW